VIRVNEYSSELFGDVPAALEALWHQYPPLLLTK